MEGQNLLVAVEREAHVGGRWWACATAVDTASEAMRARQVDLEDMATGFLSVRRTKTRLINDGCRVGQVGDVRPQEFGGIGREMVGYGVWSCVPRTPAGLPLPWPVTAP